MKGTDMPATATVEIPADVRDNSEKVIDYAFMRHLAQTDFPYHTVQTRDAQIRRVPMYPYLYLTHYQWHDVNPGGQRCRFDMIVNGHGDVTDLFHTEYFTRVACAECEYSAGVYQVIQTEDGMSDAVPRCDHHADRFRRAIAGESVILHESERLRIGQHD